MKPSDFVEVFPWNSVFRNSDYETIARNILVVKSKLDDTWGEITWEQYKEKRLKDGNFSEVEKDYFDKVVDYCKDEESVRKFSPDWRDLKNDK